MGKNLAQTALTAIIFAAIWCFLAPFVPVSESYGESLSAFVMPKLGYVFMIAYGLWISIILALIFSSARGKGVVLTLLTAVPLLFTQWITPAIRQIFFGEASGVMTRTDLIFEALQGIAATIFLLVIALLLFKQPHEIVSHKPPHVPPKKPDKYLIKKRNFAITLIVLPVIYMVVFFLTWYFLLLSNAEARTFYTGIVDEQAFSDLANTLLTDNKRSFSGYLVNMLLTDNKQIPMSLIKGLLYSLPLIPLLLELAHKRAMFIITTVMLLIGPALRMLVPSAVMPAGVRIAHLIEMSVAAVVFGALAAFMMHMCVFKEPTKAPPPPPKPKHAAAQPQD